MDPFHQYNDIPWELIESALQDRLSREEELQFGEWLAGSTGNQQTFARIRQLWEEGLEDYQAWREADEGKAWEVVRQSIDGKKVIRPDFRAGKTRIFRMAAAAVVLLAIGTTWWYQAGKKLPQVYETARDEQRNIALPDGSTVLISPQSRITVAADYNKGGRTILLAAGEAHFEVSHQARIPFQVEMDGVSVRDIGTGFTVQRTKEKIQVMVSNGKVAFTIKETGDSRELSAGSSLIYYISENRFGEVTPVDTADGSVGSRRYINSPLAEVIAALEKSSGKRITLGDSVSDQKRLTIDIRGESVENSLKVICASLDLEYMENDGGFILKKRVTR